jgi:hypothetical protein
LITVILSGLADFRNSPSMVDPNIQILLWLLDSDLIVTGFASCISLAAVRRIPGDEAAYSLPGSAGETA